MHFCCGRQRVFIRFTTVICACYIKPCHRTRLASSARWTQGWYLLNSYFKQFQHQNLATLHHGVRTIPTTRLSTINHDLSPSLRFTKTRLGEIIEDPDCKCWRGSQRYYLCCLHLSTTSWSMWSSVVYGFFFLTCLILNDFFYKLIAENTKIDFSTNFLRRWCQLVSTNLWPQ